MDRLINELTVYSGIDSNRIPYHFHKINVSEYFGDCIEEVGLDLESKNIELNYSNLAAPNTVIIADPEQLKRVINNIIGNSVKYIDKERGEIDIRILDEIDSIRVEIEDNGKGIYGSALRHLFWKLRADCVEQPGTDAVFYFDFTALLPGCVCAWLGFRYGCRVGSGIFRSIFGCVAAKTGACAGDWRGGDVCSACAAQFYDAAKQCDEARAGVSGSYGAA